jgi:glycosyltransferase involved in cell wall biosynthesis
MSPKVSIIVPVYNVETYLDTCVESLLCQSLRDIEIILIDDGSQDRCPEMVDEYATNDSRIIAIHQKNGGVSAARNTGLDCATAPYVMFCDPDDFYDANMCELMLDSIESSTADIVACGTKILYEIDELYKAADERYYSLKFEGLKESKELSERACDVSCWNKIFRRSIITEHGLRFPAGLKFEDFYFFHAYMVYAKQIFFLKEKLHNYRRRVGSIMNQTFNSRRTSSLDHLKCSILLWDLFKKEGILEERKEYIYDIFFEGFYFALHHAGCMEEKQEVLKFACDFAQRQLGITGRPTLFFYRKKDRKMYRIIRKSGMDYQTKKLRFYPFLRILFYRFLASISRGDKRSYYLEKLEKLS